MLTQGAYADLGNGVAGIVSIRWKNAGNSVSDEHPNDPQYIFGISLLDMGADAGIDGGADAGASTGATGTWLPSAPVTSGLGVPVCVGDEGLGVTGVVFAACSRPDTAPTARVQLTIGDTTYSLIGLMPPGALYSPF